MAQCAAAHEALRTWGGGGSGRGFLVAVRELRITVQRLEADAVLRVRTRREAGRPGLGVLSHACSVHAEREGALLAEGRITIALDRSQGASASRGPA
jgi:predicted hotdog family 3-hydroxylacyl-ACP dehydratase